MSQPHITHVTKTGDNHCLECGVLVNEKPENELEGRDFDELSTILIQLCTQVNPDLVYTHDDIKKARRELLAWRDKAVREADRKTLETISVLLNGDDNQVEVVKNYISNKLKMYGELKGDSND